MAKNRNTNTPKPAYYPDLHGANYYRPAENVTIYVKDGIITVSDTKTNQFVMLSEWDMGGFVEAWLRDRGTQHRKSWKTTPVPQHHHEAITYDDSIHTD